MSTDEYVSADALARLAGYKPNQYKRIAGWLIKQGWPVETDRCGRPIVARAVYDKRMGVRTAQLDEVAVRLATGPDYNALAENGSRRKNRSTLPPQR
jgi:hypothetical protein